MMPMSERIRRVAEIMAVGFVGADVKEEPPGSNKGFFVERFQEYCGGKAGHAWCMYFQHYIFDTAHDIFGVRYPLLRSGHCYSVWQDAQDKTDRIGIITAAQALDGRIVPPGSMYIRFKDDGAVRPGHTGIVVYQKLVGAVGGENDIVRCIEGNHKDQVAKVQHTLGALKDKGLAGFITGRDAG